MAALLRLLGVVAALALSAFSSGTETALYRASRVKMRLLRDKGDRRAGLALRLLDRLDRLVTTILVSNNIANYAGTYFLTTQLIAWGVPSAEFAATLLLTPTFFILGESLPKQMAYAHASAFAYAAAPAITALSVLFAPAVWVLNKASSVLRRAAGLKAGAETVSSGRARLMEYFEAGVADKILTEDQNRMARRIMEWERINAADIMIPVSRILLLPERTGFAGAVKAMASAKADLAMLTGGAGRVTGRVVTANGLVRNSGNPEAPVAAFAVELGGIKSGTSFPEVLLWLKRQHAQRAAVTERGRVIGVITARSILERIAGM